MTNDWIKSFYTAIKGPALGNTSKSKQPVQSKRGVKTINGSSPIASLQTGNCKESEDVDDRRMRS